MAITYTKLKDGEMHNTTKCFDPANHVWFADHEDEIRRGGSIYLLTHCQRCFRKLREKQEIRIITPNCTAGKTYG